MAKEKGEFTTSLRSLLLSTCVIGAVALSAVPASGAVIQACATGLPTAASRTWDFKGEANTILKDVEDDARQAEYHADKLQSYTAQPALDWQAHAYHLERLKTEINDIGGKICRLETIRRVVSPSQQRVIDEIAGDSRLMASNTQKAIVFGNTRPRDLWLAAYHNYLNNLYGEVCSLTQSVGTAVKFARVSKHYQGLRHELGM